MEFDVERDLMPLAKGAAFFAALIVLVVLGRLAKGVTAGYALDAELTREDNPAVGVSYAGYVGGLLLALSGVFFGEGSGDFTTDLLNVGAWGAFAILALNASRLLVDRVILAGFTNVEELVRDRNLGVGACEAGGYLASGLVVRAAVMGEGAWWLAPVYLVLGLVLLIFGCVLLNRVIFRRFNLTKAIEADNVACGILFGLHILAVGWVIQDTLFEMALETVVELAPTTSAMREGLAVDLGLGALYMLVAVGGLAILAAVTDRLMLPGSRLKAEVVDDQSTGAALVSGVVAVAGAVILTSIF